MNRPKPRPHIAAPDVSRCVLLKNCFNAAEENGTAWVKELEDDVKLECESKYGKVFPPPSLLEFGFNIFRSIISTSKKTRMVKFTSNSTVSVPEKRRSKG